MILLTFQIQCNWIVVVLQACFRIAPVIFVPFTQVISLTFAGDVVMVCVYK